MLINKEVRLGITEISGGGGESNHVIFIFFNGDHIFNREVSVDKGIKAEPWDCPSLRC